MRSHAQPSARAARGDAHAHAHAYALVRSHAQCVWCIYMLCGQVIGMHPCTHACMHTLHVYLLCSQVIEQEKRNAMHARIACVLAVLAGDRAGEA